MSLTDKENSIFTALKKIVVQQLSVKPDEVKLDANFINDLRADSLDMVELVMAIEEGFDIEVPDDIVGDIKTVQEAVSFINDAIENEDV
nr:acyl carrier protein [Calliblepharis sp.]